MTYESRLEELKQSIRKAEYLKYTMNSLVYWDKITYMPPEGIEYRSKVMAFMANEQQRLLSQEGFRSHLEYLLDHKKNSPETTAMLRRIQRNAQYVGRIPEAKYRQYIELIALSEQVWEKARKENDFASFHPYLEKIFETFRQFAQYWGYEKHPYDALLGYYEEGLTVEQVDSLLKELKPFLIQSLGKIRSSEDGSQSRPPSGQTAKSRFGTFLNLPKIDQQRQQMIWEMILSEIGFRFEAGRIDIGAHPTILANSPSDVRIVNSYDVNDLGTGIFNALHSGGKGIYQQSIPKELLGTFLAEVPSFALEEGIGRFYENIVGRSHGFWSYFYDKILDILPEFSQLSVQQIYENVNIAQPALRRIEADELTYLLHIIIRYELEREIIDGRQSIQKLPQAWNQKYQEYLGTCPPNDGEGILQDIHWAAGYVGYFPAYFIANLAAAQIKAALEKDCGSIDLLAETGQFTTIKNWLKEHLFQFGARYPTRELMERATGRPLDSCYYMEYLRKKYSEVYKTQL
ncbi:MAG: carboxypeptidase M32 [Lachnospiraceae bacterium]|jgi:carboxypeptidase Taq|nr:carboxypeptidase M32 [Lachnospiraceae bacterium]